MFRASPAVDQPALRSIPILPGTDGHTTDMVFQLLWNGSAVRTLPLERLYAQAIIRDIAMHETANSRHGL